MLWAPIVHPCGPHNLVIIVIVQCRSSSRHFSAYRCIPQQLCFSCAYVVRCCLTVAIFFLILISERHEPCFMMYYCAVDLVADILSFSFPSAIFIITLVVASCLTSTLMLVSHGRKRLLKNLLQWQSVLLARMTNL